MGGGRWQPGQPGPTEGQSRDPLPTLPQEPAQCRALSMYTPVTPPPLSRHPSVTTWRTLKLQPQNQTLWPKGEGGPEEGLQRPKPLSTWNCRRGPAVRPGLTTGELGGRWAPILTPAARTHVWLRQSPDLGLCCWCTLRCPPQVENPALLISCASPDALAGQTLLLTGTGLPRLPWDACTPSVSGARGWASCFQGLRNMWG